MRKTFALLLTLLMWAAAPARGQAPAADAEKEDVRKVVETYLFSEEADEKRATFLEDARIVFVGADGKESRVEAVSKGGKGRTRGKIGRATQKVISVDVLNDAASVKVETVLAPDEPDVMKHSQYLWLLKTKTGWKIAGILMPGVAPVARPGDR